MIIIYICNVFTYVFNIIFIATYIFCKIFTFEENITQFIKMQTSKGRKYIFHHHNKKL